MIVTVQSLADAVRRMEAALLADEAKLNSADSLMGDGDTGSMLTRMFTAIAHIDFEAIDDIGQAFREMARAGSSTTGSSLGTLIIVALITVAKATNGNTSLDAHDIAAHIGAAKLAMMTRGRSAIGDKTIIDGLDFVERAIGDTSTDEPLAIRAVVASRLAVEDFRNRTSRVGRARLLAVRSVGLDDPGMLALCTIVRAIANSE